MIADFFKKECLITDGAMGTYYSEITGEYKEFCEFANINKKDIVKRIHKEYIDAGAKLIRTNTFSANCITLKIKREMLKEIIDNAVSIAREAAEGRDVFIAASIGPVPEDKLFQVNILDEYKFIADTFLELGIDIFIFETFSSLKYLSDISKYIKGKNKNACIITQFAVMPTEYTRDGISIKSIINGIKAIKEADIYGFNCGSGPTHLYNMLKDKPIFNDVVSVLPNSGYPELVNERMLYINNPEYFAEKMMDIKRLGARILGGCCGTTPEHIRVLCEKLKKEQQLTVYAEAKTEEAVSENINQSADKFHAKLLNNQFVTAVELDPPFNTDITKIMNGAQICKDNDVDLVTIADSPMSKVRVDSVMIAAKIKRETGIDTMPHICCRDKNINAIRASLLAAHIEEIRNILAITGDPVSTAEKQNIKDVFNLNSFKLIELISEMNNEVFSSDRMNIGAALNLNVLNKDKEVERMKHKIDKGADFFLTQPIYDDKTIEYLSKMKREKGIKIIGGILPLVSLRNAEFINNELPGVYVPKNYVKRFSKDMSKAEAEQAGIELAVEIAQKFIDFVDGVYLMTPFNRFEMIMKIIKQIRK